MAEPAGQAALDAYFEEQSSFWDGIYRGNDVYSLIHQHRLRTTLSWVDQLALPRGARVLEVGCGAGVTAVALAQRGFRVQATDTVPAMVELTGRRARAACVDEHIDVGLSDAHALPFGDGTFDLVVALGVVPWLESPRTGVAEMGRVTKAGGALIANADNAARLSYLLDPRHHPRLASARVWVKKALQRAGIRRGATAGARSNVLSMREFDELLSSAGIDKVTGCTFGFGPFTLLGRPVLPQRLGVALQRRLQELADRGVPGLRRTGAQYIVLGRKRPVAFEAADARRA